MNVDCSGMGNIRFSNDMTSHINNFSIDCTNESSLLPLVCSGISSFVIDNNSFPMMMNAFILEGICDVSCDI